MGFLAGSGHSLVHAVSRLSGDYFPEILVIAVLGLLLWAIRKTFHGAPHSPF